MENVVVTRHRFNLLYEGDIWLRILYGKTPIQRQTDNECSNLRVHKILPPLLNKRQVK